MTSGQWGLGALQRPHMSTSKSRWCPLPGGAWGLKATNVQRGRESHPVPLPRYLVSTCRPSSCGLLSPGEPRDPRQPIMHPKASGRQPSIYLPDSSQHLRLDSHPAVSVHSAVHVAS